MDPCVDIIKELLKTDPLFEGVYDGGWDYLDMGLFRKPYTAGEVDFEAVRLLFDILLARSGRLKKPGRARSLANTWKDRTGLKGDPYLFLCLAAVLGDAHAVREVVPLCEKPDPKRGIQRPKHSSRQWSTSIPKSSSFSVLTHIERENDVLDHLL
jgi:hypothetical protein